MFTETGSRRDLPSWQADSQTYTPCGPAARVRKDLEPTLSADAEMKHEKLDLK
jgi:hypothetical protein